MHNSTRENWGNGKLGRITATFSDNTHIEGGIIPWGTPKRGNKTKDYHNQAMSYEDQSLEHYRFSFTADSRITRRGSTHTQVKAVNTFPSATGVCLQARTAAALTCHGHTGL